MIIIADLYTERGIWRADSAYVFAENDPLSVSFGEDHGGDTLSVRSNSRVRTIRLDEHGGAEIPSEMIENGTILMHVERYINGNLVRDWKVDPLTIIVKDENVSATPWTVSVEERISDLENALFGQSSPLFE